MFGNSWTSFETCVSVIKVGSGSKTVVGLLLNQDKMLIPVCKSYYNLPCCFKTGCSIESIRGFTSVFTLDVFESGFDYFYEDSLPLSSVFTYLLTILRVLPPTCLKGVFWAGIEILFNS